MTQSRSPVAFGPYIITRRIARGGMAEIYRARTRSTPDLPSRWVAIKMMRPAIGHEELREQLFKREARIASAIQHANVVPLLEFGLEMERYYIAMEYVRGRDLSYLLKNEMKGWDLIPLELGLYVGLQAAAGLGYAHRLRDERGEPLGIVHRDISPGNVMIGYDGDVKVLDFGVARMNDSEGMRTQTGTLRGKFAYMSPEQTLGEPLDARSDVFSLGTVLYELLTGSNCFRTDNPIATLDRVQRVRPVPPSRANREIPQAIDRILARCLAKDRRRRFPDCAALAEALGEFLDKWGGSGRDGLAGQMAQRFAWEMREEAEELKKEEEEVALLEVVDFALVGEDVGLDASHVAVSLEEEASQVEVKKSVVDEDGEEVFDFGEREGAHPGRALSSFGGARSGDRKRFVDDEEVQGRVELASLLGSPEPAPGPDPAVRVGNVDPFAATATGDAATDDTGPMPVVREPSPPAPARTTASNARALRASGPEPPAAPSRERPPVDQTAPVARAPRHADESGAARAGRGTADDPGPRARSGRELAVDASRAPTPGRASPRGEPTARPDRAGRTSGSPPNGGAAADLELAPPQRRASTVRRAVPTAPDLQASAVASALASIGGDDPSLADNTALGTFDPGADATVPNASMAEKLGLRLVGRRASGSPDEEVGAGPGGRQRAGRGDPRTAPATVVAHSTITVGTRRAAQRLARPAVVIPMLATAVLIVAMLVNMGVGSRPAESDSALSPMADAGHGPRRTLLEPVKITVDDPAKRTPAKPPEPAAIPEKAAAQPTVTDNIGSSSMTSAGARNAPPVPPVPPVPPAAPAAAVEAAAVAPALGAASPAPARSAGDKPANAAARAADAPAETRGSAEDGKASGDPREDRAEERGGGASHPGRGHRSHRSADAKKGRADRGARAVGAGNDKGQTSASGPVGYLNVRALPWAEILIDNEKWPYAAPQARIPVPPGKHTIVLRNPKTGVTRSVNLKVEVNATHTIVEDMNKR